MERQDIRLANTVLRVLTSPGEGASGYTIDPDSQGKGNTAVHIEGCLLVDYNLKRNPVLSLPREMHHVTEMVIRHLEISGQSDPWGMLDDDVIVLKLSDHPQSHSGRLLLFRISFVSKLLVKLFPNEKFTAAEQKTLLQTLSGLTLKQAAEKDSVSYETKKSHLKSVFLKSQTNRQQALSSFLITHLTLELAANHSRQGPSAESDEMFFHYVDRYMGSYVRASVIQESPDRRYRLIEIGDPAGRPVVCIHHLGLLNFSENEIAAIYSKRIRLICPLRHGALGPKDLKISREQHIEHAVGGIDLAVSLAAQKKATIISLLSGCLYAFKYLESHADKVGRLIMFGASYKVPVKPASNSSFKKNLHQLAVSHKDTLDSTVAVLLDNVANPAQLKKVMKESHNHGSADFQAIDEIFVDKNQVSAMQHRLTNSPISIAQDLQTQAISGWVSMIENDYCLDVHFIHGSADTLIPIQDIEQLIKKKSRYQLHTVEGAGNWIFGRHTEQTFTIVSGILDNNF